MGGEEEENATRERRRDLSILTIESNRKSRLKHKSWINLNLSDRPNPKSNGRCCFYHRSFEQLTGTSSVSGVCPHDVEENEPLPTSHVASAAVPAGLLVDINLVTSIPDTYSAPPIPLPYDVGLLCSETVTRNIENCSNKTDNVQSMNSLVVGETVNAAAFENSNTCEGLIGSECKGKSDSPKVKEDEISKLYEPFLSPMEEDVCPTCLEEYDKENPRIITKCEHHFHLSCILEWTERSNTCPICDQIMVIDHTSEE